MLMSRLSGARACLGASATRQRLRRYLVTTIVAVGASACGSGAPGAPSAIAQSWPESWVQFEEQVLVLVNQRRAAGATCGDATYPPVGALYMQPQLRAAARGHSLDMAEHSYFSHTSLDGRTFSQRIRAEGYSASPLGENIAAGYATPQAVVNGWMSSSGHCSNIMGANYKALGVGYAFSETATHRHYWTQNFGGS